MVLASSQSRSGDEEAREALAKLCRTYWRPVFSFVLRHRHSVADAQDLTQDFFVKVIEGNLLQRADPQRGRFRTLLLTALQNFLCDAHAKRSARKRGGDVEFLSWDDWMADAPSQLTLSRRMMETWPPEQLFDVRWAATLVERAQLLLARECENQGRRRVFEIMRGCLSAEREDVCYAALSAELRLEEAAVKCLLHRMRRRYRELLRELVAETVGEAGDVNEELRYLCTALAAGAER